MWVVVTMRQNGSVSEELGWKGERWETGRLGRRVWEDLESAQAARAPLLSSLAPLTNTWHNNNSLALLKDSSWLIHATMIHFVSKLADYLFSLT